MHVFILDLFCYVVLSESVSTCFIPCKPKYNRQPHAD